MGEFQLQMPELGSSLYRAPRLTLGDYHLKLSTETQAILADLRAQKRSELLRRAWRLPDWSSYDRAAEIGKQLSKPLPPGSKCSWYKPGRGPSKPRRATYGDALNAVYRIPCVRKFADEHLERVQRFGQGVWDGAGPAGKTGIVVGAIAVVGAGVALGPLSGRDLPVPKVPGLTMRFALGADAVPPGLNIAVPPGAYSFGLAMDFAEVFDALK
jgi:hypothetical protein